MKYDVQSRSYICHVSPQVYKCFHVASANKKSSGSAGQGVAPGIGAPDPLFDHREWQRKWGECWQQTK